MNKIEKLFIIYLEKMNKKNWRKIIQQLLLMCYVLKNKTCILPMFQNTTQIVKKIVKN